MSAQSSTILFPEKKGVAYAQDTVAVNEQIRVADIAGRVLALERKHGISGAQ